MLHRAALAASLLALFAVSGSAQAENANPMIGTWKWTDYTIDVKECTTNPSGAGICGTVTAGPKNVGMEMIRSKLEQKDAFYIGQIAHPATGEIYDTKMNMKDSDTWSMDGCTTASVCAKGDFIRVK